MAAERFDFVDSLKYFHGSLSATVSDMPAEIAKRMRCASLWYRDNERLLMTPKLPIKFRMLIYNTLMRPILTYGCEVWTLTKSLERDLLNYERCVLALIYKSGSTSNKEPAAQLLYSVYNFHNIIHYIKIERLKWAGHLAAEENCLRRFIDRNKHGGERKVRIRERDGKVRWYDEVNKDTLPLGLKMGEWVAICKNPSVWNNLIRKADKNNLFAPKTKH